MTMRAYTSLLMGSLLTLAGCDDYPGRFSASGSNSLRRLSDGFCGFMSRCCAADELARILPFTGHGDCAERVFAYADLGGGMDFGMTELLGVDLALTLPNPGALDEAIEDGRVKVDREAVVACLEHMEALECPKFEEPEADRCMAPDPPSDDGPCEPERLFVGRREQGEACTSSAGTMSLECAPGLICRATAMLGVEGRCAPFSQEGDVCYDNEHCAEDLYCSLVDGTCQPYRNEGESCVPLPVDPFVDLTRGLLLCAAGLTCDPVTDRCVAPCGLGASCTTDEDCDPEEDLVCLGGRCDQLRAEGQACAAPSDCEPDLACSLDPFEPTRRRCQRLLATGDPCREHADCESGFCDPGVLACAASVEPGDVCPSGQDAECRDGRCVAESATCEQDADCPQSGSCDSATGQCSAFCTALFPEGQGCTQNSECLSGRCVAGACRTPPLAAGTACDADTQCDSGFCSPGTNRRCAELPLGLGALCTASEQCESGVCYFLIEVGAAACVEGLGQGEACAGSDKPCDPKSLYCDLTRTTPVCVPLKEGGEMCTDSAQCRGDCQSVFGRSVCSLVAAEGTAVCDGAE